MPLIQSAMLCGSGRPVALPLPLITLFLIALLSPSGSQQLVGLSKTINRAAQLALESSNNVTKIAFASDRDGNFEIYVMDADGGGQLRLTDNPGEDFQPSWSPDGNRIAFVSTRDGNAEIYVMNNDGSNQTRLTNNAADDLSPTWSPVGDLIAFVSGRDGNDEIYLMNVDGSNQRNLTVHAADDSSLSFSPDGMTIVFSSSREDSRFNLYQMNVDGSMVTRLTSTEGDDINPVRSLQRLTFQSNRDDNEEIYSLDLNGSQTRLTNNSDIDIDPTQQPGGGNICFATNRDGNLEIYLMGSNGGDLRRLTTNSAADIQPALQPTGVVPVPPGSEDTIIQFNMNNYSVGEGETRATLTVARIGKTDGISAVDFVTVDGDADTRNDFVFRGGTLSFNPGETQKSLTVLLIDDVFIEQDESFTVTLSNPKGAALGSLNTATVTISDNDTASNQPNPINNARFFVNQHYFDFLNREPDAAGLDFWTNEITSCGSNFPCLMVRRINVSAAFYLSIEFRETGYLVYRIYKTAYGNRSGVPVPLRLNEFLPDTQEIGRGVVVGVGDWQAQLESNKNTFLADFVVRTRFMTAYPATMAATQFVDTLNQNAGGVLTQAERDQLVNDLTNGAKTRAQVLRTIAEDADLVQMEFNRAFVLMQYFGYLRRNPNDAPDFDFSGYNFWLNKLNEFNGNFVNAEMVKAFIESNEYMKRFGP